MVSTIKLKAPSQDPYDALARDTIPPGRHATTSLPLAYFKL
jgi:hypothetical protein